MNKQDTQRKAMFDAHQKQKELIKKRDELIKSKKDDDKKAALLITHDIAELEDFIRNSENKLRMTD